MSKRKRKKKPIQVQNPQEKVLSLIENTARQNSVQRLQDDKVLKENPLKGSNMAGYRQQMNNNAITCRKISEQIDIIQSIIRYMISKTRPYLKVSKVDTEAGFRVVLRDGAKKVTSAEEKDIAELESFFLNCGIDKDISEEVLQEYVAKLIRDYISIDHFSTQVLYNLHGDIVGFCAVDSASIVPLQPRDKESLQADYVQMSDGIEYELLTKEEIIFSVGNPHNDIDELRLPGTPVVLTAADLLFMHIMAEKHNANRFRNDHIPRGALLAQNTGATPTNVSELQQFFADAMNGNTSSMPWGIPIIPSPDKESKLEWINFNQNNRDMEFSQIYEVCMSIIASMFQVDLTELGIHSTHSNKMENNQQLGRYLHATDRSTSNILSFIELHFNNILSYISPDYVFQFTAKQQLDSQKLQTEEKHRLATDASVNEIRAEKDLPTWGEKDSPLWNYPNTADSRAGLQQLDHYLTVNEQRTQLGLKPLKEEWANVPVTLLPQAYQAVQQAEMQEQMPEQEEEGNPEQQFLKNEYSAEPETPQELPTIEDITKSNAKPKAKTWPFRQLEIVSARYSHDIDKLENAIYKCLEQVLGLPVLEEVLKSEANENLIFKGNIIFDPESGNPIKKKDFDKLIEAINKYIEKYGLSGSDIVLTPEIIGRIIGRSYINGSSYEDIAALEFQDMQYRGYKFDQIYPELDLIKKIIKPSERELARIEYAIENAAGLLQKASNTLTNEVKKVITNSIVQQSSKRKTAENLRMSLGKFNRDWLMIANTELTDAQCNATVAELAANVKEGEPVLLKRLENYDQAVCDTCKFYNNKIAMLVEGEREDDIAPDEHIADYLIWHGKNNYGKKKAEWQLSIGSIHPNCRGSWQPYTEKESNSGDLFAENERKNELKTKLWEQAEAEASKPIIMPDGTKRKPNNNASGVYGRLIQEAKAQGLL